jgi:flagellar hook-associated protein 3 FlgL
MRVTHGMVAETSLRNIERNLGRMEELQDQITSGTRIRKPSDDPIAVARAMSFQEGLDQADQHLRNVENASAWLNATDFALDGAGGVVQRARELALLAANASTSPQDRTAIQAEVEQLQQQALTLANSKHGSRFLFSGTRSDQAAYIVPSSSSYQGDLGTVERDVSPGVAMGININGSSVFNPLFDALAGLKSALTAGSVGGIQASIDGLDTALDGVLTARAQVGAKMNRLESLKGRLEDIQVSLTRLLSETKDVDMAEAITAFSVQENVYKASLAAAAKSMQPSLLDYLR